MVFIYWLCAGYNDIVRINGNDNDYYAYNNITISRPRSKGVHNNTKKHIFHNNTKNLKNTRAGSWLFGGSKQISLGPQATIIAKMTLIYYNKKGTGGSHYSKNE